MKKAGYRFPEKVAVASEGNPTALYEKSWLRFLKKVAVASERQAGSFLEQDSTEVPKFTFCSFLPLRESCWGVPSPNPAYAACTAEKSLKIIFRIFQKQFRFTPCFSPISERTPHTERRSADHEKIQHTAPQPGSQDTHDRGRIRRVCGKAFFLQHEPSRVYPASHNRGSHTPHHNCFPRQ